MSRLRILAATTAMVMAMPVAAAERQGTRISFHAQAQRAAPNDLGSATAYVETAGTNSTELAQAVNATLAEALALAKTHGRVTVRTGNSRTWPIHGAKPKSNGQPPIEGWRMRSELLLESRDPAALAALLGQLQSVLAVSDLGFSPSPETRRRVEDEAALDALRLFRERAARYAASFKRGYRIRSLSVHGGATPPPPATRAAAVATGGETAMPIEAGDSSIVVTVEGQIELIEPAARP